MYKVASDVSEKWMSELSVAAVLGMRQSFIALVIVEDGAVQERSIGLLDGIIVLFMRLIIVNMPHALNLRDCKGFHK